jgi:hypothetical protein
VETLRQKESIISIDAQHSESAKRYARYEVVVAKLTELSDFELPTFHDTLPSESKGFITRLVNELVETGWIVCEDSAAKEYRHQLGAPTRSLSGGHQRLGGLSGPLRTRSGGELL